MVLVSVLKRHHKNIPQTQKGICKTKGNFSKVTLLGSRLVEKLRVLVSVFFLFH